MQKFAYFIFTIFLMFGCVVDQGKVSVDIKRKKSTSNASILSATVSNVQIINNQLVITGSGLNNVTNVKVDGNSLNQNFTIESQSTTQIIANSLQLFAFDISKVFNLILSDASASATFAIDFSLCNATLNGKGFDCSVSANNKEVLSYDSVSDKWKPRAMNGLSYKGAWDAGTAAPTGAVTGDYYIVSDPGGAYSVGDWAVYNGATFDKIDNSTTITNVFGRTGAVSALEGDYSLDKLLDVDLSVAPISGKVLKYDGAKWVASDDLSGGGAGSVVTSSIANSAVTDAKIDSVSASKITGTINSTQILDGTIVNADINAAAAIDYSKLNIPNTSIPYAKLNIANGDIPAAKISGLPSATAVLATTIIDGDTTHAPDGNAVFDALAGKLNTTGGNITPGYLTVPTPVLAADAANKGYVDTAISGYVSFTEAEVLATDLLGLNTGVNGPITATDSVLGAFGKLQYQVTDLKSNGQWIKTVNDISYSAGNVTVDKSFLLKDSGSNFVEIKAPATVTTSYVLTLPPNDGNVDQVLRTDGNGVLTWVNTSDSSVQAFAKTALPTCNTGEVLKSNGTSFSCVTDASGAGSFSGASNRAVATDGTGALIVSATTDTELGYVSGVTSSIQTQLNAKQATITTGTTAQYYRGDKTFVTLDTAVVPENGNLYFTPARAKSATVADAIADAVLDIAPSQNAVYDALALKISTTGGTLTVGTISGVPTPTGGSDVVNKTYADTKIPKTAIPTCSTGEVLKADGTNFTCVTDVTGAGAFTGTASRVVQTGFGGALEVSATTSTELEYVSGVTSSIQTQLNAKQATITAGTTAQYFRGDKTFVTLNSAAVPELTNLYFTEPRVLASILTSLNTGVNGPITATDSVLGAFGKLQYQITDLKTFDTSVQTFAKNTLPTCGAGEVLKSNGSAFSCVTDASGAAAFSGTINRAIASDGTGALSVSNTTATELGYVSGVTSSIQTQLNAKEGSVTAGTTAQYFRGDKTWRDFTSDVLGSTLAALTPTNSMIIAGDTVATSFNKTQGQLNAIASSYVAKNGTNVLTGVTAVQGITARMTVPTPLITDTLDATNVSYVQTAISNAIGTNGVWAKSGSDISYTAGNIGVGTASPTSKFSVVSNGPASGTEGNLNYTVYSNIWSPIIGIQRAMNTEASPSSVDNALGGIEWKGYDGSQFVAGAAIYSNAIDGYGTSYKTKMRLATHNGTALLDRMVINDLGNVGIGTTTPAGKLDINGSLFARGSSSQIRLKETDNADPEDAWHLSMNGGDLITYWEDNSAGPSYTPILTQKTNGNIGVGTSAPSAKLQVNGVNTFSSGGSSYSSTIWLGNGAYQDIFFAPISLGSYNGGMAIYPGTIPGSGAASFSTYFKSRVESGASTRHDLLVDGNVGIGTTSPAVALEVLGTQYVGSFLKGTGYKAASVGASANGYAAIGYGIAYTGTGLNYNYANSDYASWIDYNSGQLNFKVAPIGIAGNAITATTAMTVNNTGNIGIGTTTPTYKLDILGSGTDDGVKVTLATNTANNAFVSYGGANTIHNLYHGANDEALYAQSYNGATTNLIRAQGSSYFNSGNLGIGTTTPSSTLHLLNSSGSTATIEHAGSGTVTAVAFRQGSPSAQVGSITMSGGSSAAYNTTSDVRTKENFSLTRYGLKDLLRLPVREYSYKQDPSHKRVTGFIAQELNEIFPDAVTTNGDNGIEPLIGKDPWSVDYGKITPLLTNSLKQFATVVDVSTADLKQTAIKIDSSGSVGIGTVNPEYKLDVQGGDINASGNVRASGMSLTSDLRFKRNIQPLENAIEKLKKINGVTYVWAREEYPEKHFNKAKQIGVIAQDVQKVFPELVFKDSQGFLSVNYPALLAPLIEAFKGQQEQIEKNLSTFNLMKFGILKKIDEHSRAIASLEIENENLQKELKAQKLEVERQRKENQSIKLRLEKIEKLLQNK